MTLQYSLKMAHQVINLFQEDQKDNTGPLFQDVKSHNNTMNANRYCQMHHELWTMIKNKHHGKTHQWHHNAAQQSPSTCGLQSVGPTDSQVMAGVQTS